MSEQPVLTVYMDFTCPFCFIGEKPLRKLEAEGEVEVVRRVFLTNRQEAAVEGAGESIWQGVEALSTRFEVDLARSPFDASPRHAFVGLKYAEEQDRTQPWVDTVFRAQFQLGLDLNSLDALADIAWTAGLDPGTLLDHIREGTYDEALDAELEEARQSGIFVGPTYLVEERRLTGVHSFQNLKRLLRGEALQYRWKR